MPLQDFATKGKDWNCAVCLVRVRGIWVERIVADALALPLDAIAFGEPWIKVADVEFILPLLGVSIMRLACGVECAHFCPSSMDIYFYLIRKYRFVKDI